jgi:hypothetical protein
VITGVGRGFCSGANLANKDTIPGTGEKSNITSMVGKVSVYSLLYLMSPASVRVHVLYSYPSTVPFADMPI